MMETLSPKVAVAKCSSYDIDQLSQNIHTILEQLGGLGKYIHPGQRVLLKPNLISAKDPARAITTHPEIVAAVAREVRKLGAEPVVGDSPGGAKRGLERVWRNTGMKDMAEREGLELINFEAGGSERFRVNGRSYFLAKAALEADAIINLPKLKTHVLTLMTGAVKNMFGLIPGFRKGNYHKEYPRPEDFAGMIVDILSLRMPTVTIMDGILAMEGDGPASGEPRKLGLLLASPDPVALDTIASEIIGLKHDQVPTTRIASEAGLGIGWPEAIEVTGERLEELRINDFKLPSNRKFELVPKLIWKVAGSMIWIRPAIHRATCNKCANCVQSCPTGALKWDGDKFPVFNYDLCINCWCCHELCPEKSIYINKSWLAKKLLR